METYLFDNLVFQLHLLAHSTVFYVCPILLDLIPPPIVAEDAKGSGYKPNPLLPISSSGSLNVIVCLGRNHDLYKV